MVPRIAVSFYASPLTRPAIDLLDQHILARVIESDAQLRICLGRVALHFGLRSTRDLCVIHDGELKYYKSKRLLDGMMTADKDGGSKD